MITVHVDHQRRLIGVQKCVGVAENGDRIYQCGKSVDVETGLPQLARVVEGAIPPDWLTLTFGELARLLEDE